MNQQPRQNGRFALRIPGPRATGNLALQDRPTYVSPGRAFSHQPASQQGITTGNFTNTVGTPNITTNRPAGSGRRTKRNKKTLRRRKSMRPRRK